MGPVIVLSEIALLTGLVCLVHRLRDRLGVAPLFMLLGLFEAFLFFVGKPWPPISGEFFFVDPRGIYLLFLPTILVSAVIVYALDGTRAARQFMLGLVILYIVHGLLDVIVDFHASHPPPGHKSLEGDDLVWYSLGSRLASIAAIVVDFLLVIIVFQFVRNRFPRIPLAIPLFIGLVVAMLADAVVYKLLRHGHLSEKVFYLGAKAQAGVAAGLPAALYVAYMLRRHPIEESPDLERGALEIIGLRKRLAQMQETLKEQRAQYLYIKDTFSRYVSAEVVNAIIADPARLALGGELRHVTVLFADIRGYSTLSENLAPTEVIELLNRYFSAVSAVILDEQGMINEFEGDAVLAVFGAPLTLEDHAERGVTTALRMLEVVEELNAAWAEDGTMAKWQAAGIDRLAIRIGVHSGEVVAGNIGSEARIKYAIIGDTVNTTSRVEGLNKVLKTSLLVTDATVKCISKPSILDALNDQGEHAVKGRAEPVHVYSLNPPGTG